MDTHHRRDFTLGVLFFVFLGLLLYYTIVLTGFTLAEKSHRTAWFPNAMGLKEGDSVHVAGRPSGTVREVRLEYDRPEDRRIAVRMEFLQEPRLREGYTIRIAEFSALGGRVVQIDPGAPDAAPLAAGAELVGTVSPSAMESLAALVDENREDVRRIIDSLRATAEGLEAGEGLLGALLHDDQLQGDVRAAAESARALLDDVRAGKGTLGALIQDEETRERILAIVEDTQSTMQDLGAVAADLREGRGALGALLSDPEMRAEVENVIDNLDDAVSRLQTFVEDASEGRGGLLGALVADDALAEDARRFLDDLAEVSRRLREGEGSLGRLMAEEEAYEELLQALQSLNAQLEDAREAQPVSSFAGLLFGGF